MAELAADAQQWTHIPHKRPRKEDSRSGVPSADAPWSCVWAEEADPMTSLWDEDVAATNETAPGQPGPITIGNFLWQHYLVLDEELGKGRFGVVRTCISRTTGEQFACKTMLKADLTDEASIEGIQTEVSLMGVLSAHPNIVRYEGAYEDEHSVHLVMERCLGSDLFDLIQVAGCLSEVVAAPLFRKVVCAVGFCHSQGLAHRDLKPENVLLAVGASGAVEPKLADFGLARLLGPSGEVEGSAGSPSYMAPEVIASQAHSLASDIWSLGVLLYAMLSGALPFHGSTPFEVFEDVCRAAPDTTSDHWHSISTQAKDLIHRMLSPDPILRPTAHQVLSHLWLLSYAPEAAQPRTEKRKNVQPIDAQQVAHLAALQTLANQMEFSSVPSCQMLPCQLPMGPLLPSPPCCTTPPSSGLQTPQPSDSLRPRPAASPKRRKPSPRSSVVFLRPMSASAHVTHGMMSAETTARGQLLASSSLTNSESSVVTFDTSTSAAFS